MKNLMYGFGLLCCFIVSPGAAQEQPGNKTLAATLDIYAFPKKGQSAEQQSKDESACFDWSVSNTGVDPFKVEKESEQEEAQAAEQTEAAKGSAQGAGAHGAVRGAAAGALIAEVSHGDTSESAAAGAAVGAIASRRRARHHSEEAQEQVEQQSAAQESASAEEIGNFKKAFSACLEGKDYQVES